ncbi:MAG TPA: methyltransferase domain-containing protein [Acidobacteriota bacterium]|nr:methyltransferase domain-containing protein [Acidobacteriota bacterium]
MNVFVVAKHKIYSLLSGPQLNRYLQGTTTRKLHLGCGKNLLQGWLNTDLKYRKNRISFLDASKTFPFQNETIDFIFCEHLIEHLSFVQAKNLLGECRRILKANGTIRISMPSIYFLFDLLKNGTHPLNIEYTRWAAQRFLTKAGMGYDEDQAAVYVISNFFRDFGHKVIHSFESIQSLLLKAGFREIEQAKIGVSKTPELCMLEQHGHVIPDEFNRLETLVVEARK